MKFCTHLERNSIRIYPNETLLRRNVANKNKILSNILIYIQQDAKLHSLFYLETALHVSGGTITHHQERKQLYLQHLAFVTPLLLSAAIVEKLELVFQLFHDGSR